MTHPDEDPAAHERSGATVVEGVETASAGSEHGGVLRPPEESKPGTAPVEQVRDDPAMTGGDESAGRRRRAGDPDARGARLRRRPVRALGPDLRPHLRLRRRLIRPGRRIRPVRPYSFPHDRSHPVLRRRLPDPVRGRHRHRGHQRPPSHSPPDQIDLNGLGDPPLRLVAAAAGIVRRVVDDFSENQPGQEDCKNNYVWIEHPNGEWTKYGHMRKGSVKGTARLKEEDPVRSGQLLGIESDVGCAHGTHLHFEVGVPDDAAEPVDDNGDLRGSNRIPRICLVAGRRFVRGARLVAAPCPPVDAVTAPIDFGPVRARHVPAPALPHRQRHRPGRDRTGPRVRRRLGVRVDAADRDARAGR